MAAGISLLSESTPAAELQTLIRGTTVNEPSPTLNNPGCAAPTAFVAHQHPSSAELPEVNPLVVHGVQPSNAAFTPVNEPFRSPTYNNSSNAAGLVSDDQFNWSSEANPFVAQGVQFAPGIPYSPFAPQSLSRSPTPSSPETVVCISSTQFDGVL